MTRLTETTIGLIIATGRPLDSRELKLHKIAKAEGEVAVFVTRDDLIEMMGKLFVELLKGRS